MMRFKLELENLVKESLKEMIENEIENAISETKKNIEKQIRKEVAGIVSNTLEYVDFFNDNNRLIISVNFPTPREDSSIHAIKD